VIQKPSWGIELFCQLVGHGIIYRHRLEAAISPRCPSRTEHSRKITSSTVLHDDTLLPIDILQQFVEGDDIRMRKMLEKIDLSVDELIEHSLVIHGQLERLRSEHLCMNVRTRSSEAVAVIAQRPVSRIELAPSKVSPSLWGQLFTDLTIHLSPHEAYNPETSFTQTFDGFVTLVIGSHDGARCKQLNSGRMRIESEWYCSTYEWWPRGCGVVYNSLISRRW